MVCALRSKSEAESECCCRSQSQPDTLNCQVCRSRAAQSSAARSSAARSSAAVSRASALSQTPNSQRLFLFWFLNDDWDNWGWILYWLSWQIISGKLSKSNQTGIDIPHKNIIILPTCRRLALGCNGSQDDFGGRFPYWWLNNWRISNWLWSRWSNHNLRTLFNHDRGCLILNLPRSYEAPIVLETCLVLACIAVVVLVESDPTLAHVENGRSQTHD